MTKEMKYVTLNEAFAEYAPTMSTTYDSQDDCWYSVYKNEIVGKGKHFATSRLDAFSTLKRNKNIPINVMLNV